MEVPYNKAVHIRPHLVQMIASINSVHMQTTDQQTDFTIVDIALFPAGMGTKVNSTNH